MCRELLEETGYTAGDVRELGVATGDAYTNGRWFYYIATDCVKTSGQQLDDGEYVDVELVSVSQLLEYAKRSEMTDTAAVLMAYDELIALSALEGMVGDQK